jgi:purine catabolism regulator
MDGGELRALLSPLAPPDLVALRAAGGYALLPLEDKGGEEGVRQRVESWHGRLAARGTSVSVGLSGVHRDLAGQRLALVEAGEALLAGERVLGPGRLAIFGEMYLLRFLRDACDLTQVREFHETVLGPLMAYDRSERGETLATLEAFFAAGGSVQGTADRLGMHRNSIIYRLKRIAEITQLNLDDGDTRLRLHLALRLQQVLQLASAARPYSAQPSATPS